MEGDGERKSEVELELFFLLGEVVEDVGRGADHRNDCSHYRQMRLQLLVRRRLVRPPYCPKKHRAFLLSSSSSLPKQSLQAKP
ncbi:hypothetical protein ACLOJK_002934 [Asimina triloba]